MNLLIMHQYRVRTIYKPGLDLFIADWLSRHNHKENKDAEIPGMQLNIDAIETMTDIPDCMTMQQLQQATSKDDHLQQLKDYIIRGWPENKDQMPQDIQTYWAFQDDMAVIDGVLLKGRCVVILESFKNRH